MWGIPGSGLQAFLKRTPETVERLYQLPGPLTVPSLSIPLPASGFVTAKITAFSLSARDLTIDIQTEGVNKPAALSRLPRLVERCFNLMSFLSPHRPATLTISHAMVTELRLIRLPEWPRFPRIDLFFIAIGIGVFVLRPPKDKRSALAFWIPMSLAFTARWNALAGTIGHALSGDAIDYARLTSEFSSSHLLQTGVREPAYIWLQALAMNALGFTDGHFRLVTLLLSVAMTGVIFHLAFVFSQKKSVAFVSATLWAVGDFFVFNAVRGERNELFTLGVWSFAALSLRIPWKAWRSELALALLGCWVSLTWLLGLPSVILLYGYRWIRLRFPAGWLAVFGGVLFLGLAPFFWHHAHAHGDPLVALNSHVNFYHNTQATGVSSYEGPKRNWFEFLILEKGAWNIIWTTTSAYVQLFLNPLNSFTKSFLGFHYTLPYSYCLYPFLLFGLIRTGLRKQWMVLFFIVSIVGVAPYFLNEFRDPRLLLHAAPFFCYFTGLGLVEAVGFLTGALRGIGPLKKNRRLKAWVGAMGCVLCVSAAWAASSAVRSVQIGNPTHTFRSKAFKLSFNLPKRFHAVDKKDRIAITDMQTQERFYLFALNAQSSANPPLRQMLERRTPENLDAQFQRVQFGNRTGFVETWSGFCEMINETRTAKATCQFTETLLCQNKPFRCVYIGHYEDTGGEQDTALPPALELMPFLKSIRFN